jgi:hypothetical protein
MQAIVLVDVRSAIELVVQTTRTTYSTSNTNELLAPTKLHQIRFHPHLIQRNGFGLVVAISVILLLGESPVALRSLHHRTSV